MKNLKPVFILLLFIAFSGTIKSYGLVIKGPMAVPENIQNLKVSELVRLSAKQFSLLTGKKMNLIDRLKFNFLKMKMKHDLKKDPNLLLKDYAKGGKKKLGTGWIILIVAGSVAIIIGIILLISLKNWADGTP